MIAVSRLSIVMFTMFAALAVSKPISSGYFKGNEFTPVGKASTKLFSEEPSVVILFALDSASAEETRKFEEWYNSPARDDMTAFGIVMRKTMSDLMFEEALAQRELSFPVFESERDLLLGDSFRVLYLDDDELKASLESADPARITAAISGNLSTKRNNEKLSAKPVPTPIAELLGIAEEEATTITLTETPTSNPARRTGTYINEQFGLTVEFPKEATYVESTTGDGAVSRLTKDGARIDFRVWAEMEPNLSPENYIREHIQKLEENWKTEVRVEKRFRVVGDRHRGSDCTFSYMRPVSPAIPEAGKERVRVRIQVFNNNDMIKAAAVESPADAFNDNEKLVESYIKSFEPEAMEPERELVSLAVTGGSRDY